jgi:non-ribosomal peptide synthase protein (TIGR01720 family)
MQRGFALERAPLWSVVLYDLPDGQRLLLSAHHLIVDGVSWRVLVEDLERAFEAQALPPRSAPYAAWVEGQQRYAAAGLAAERAYWPPAAYLPAATDGGDRHADRRAVRLALSAGVTRALLTDAHKAYATEINDLLIAAVAAAWCAWTGETRCALTLEGHGREPLVEELDLARTVGWFTSIFPVAFELPPHTGVGATIKYVKETLRAIPNRGAGYGILRYLAEPRVELAPLPPLAFNYLGRFDTGADGWFAPAPEPGPETASPELALPWLELTAAVAGDEMDLALAYSARRYDERAARAFLEHVRAELERVVEHTLGREKTELTASDFDYADFTPESLDAFLRAL